MNEDILKTTLKGLLVPGKGILAADESSRTADKRFNEVGVAPSAETRRRYRQLLLTTPKIEQYLGGVIFYDETLRQATDDGVPFAEYLTSRGIISGIKTDLGLVELPGSSEQVSQGLEGLDERNQEYFKLGARFAKWRSVIKIGPGLPTELAITANAQVLAEYAKISQANNLIPIVEPEVLLDGDHSLEQSQAVLTDTLKAVFDTLNSNDVKLEYVILKTSMALPGASSTQKASADAIAQSTVAALNASVPNEVAAVVFLSGGQTPAAATANLNAISKLGPHPWFVSFSYSRALQDPVLKYWAKNPANTDQAQAIFAKRLQLASLAQRGEYSLDLETGSPGDATSTTSQD